MKRTIIHYQNTLDDKVRIVKIENVASEKEIRDQFGDTVATLYLEGTPRYKKINDSHSAIMIINQQGTIRIIIHEGMKVFKNDFSDIIKEMKNAGERLSKIRQGKIKPKIKKMII